MTWQACSSWPYDMVPREGPERPVSSEPTHHVGTKKHHVRGAGAGQGVC